MKISNVLDPLTFLRCFKSCVFGLSTGITMYIEAGNIYNETNWFNLGTSACYSTFGL